MLEMHQSNVVVESLSVLTDRKKKKKKHANVDYG